MYRIYTKRCKIMIYRKGEGYMADKERRHSEDDTRVNKDCK